MGFQKEVHTDTKCQVFCIISCQFWKSFPNQCGPEAATIKGGTLEKGYPSSISRDSISLF